jgi:hypothetical protein
MINKPMMNSNNQGKPKWEGRTRKSKTFHPLQRKRGKSQEVSVTSPLVATFGRGDKKFRKYFLRPGRSEHSGEMLRSKMDKFKQRQSLEMNRSELIER